MIGNNKAQVSMMSLLLGVIILVMVVSVVFAMVPTLSDAISQGRNMNGLNCAADAGKNDSLGVPMYNSSRTTSSLGCIITSFYMPYILIGILVAIVGAMLAGKISGGEEQRPIESYPQY